MRQLSLRSRLAQTPPAPMFACRCIFHRMFHFHMMTMSFVYGRRRGVTAACTTRPMRGLRGTVQFLSTSWAGDPTSSSQVHVCVLHVLSLCYITCFLAVSLYIGNVCGSGQWRALKRLLRCGVSPHADPDLVKQVGVRDFAAFHDRSPPLMQMGRPKDLDFNDKGILVAT